MPAPSAALCVWRSSASGDHDRSIEILIAHPGGPFWATKDDGAWSLPKGEFDPDQEAGLDAARREFGEEIGQPAPSGDAIELGESRLKSGKYIHAWALQGDCDLERIVSNTFEIEWPPRSGRRRSFPEVDRAMWASPQTARAKLNPAQAVFIDRLLEALAAGAAAG